MLVNHPSIGPTSTRRLLLRLAAAMIGGGMPVYEVEDELERVGRVLGYPSIQCSATPTGVHLALASGEASAYERIRGGLRLDQVTRVNDIRRDLMAGRLGIGPALAELSTIRGTRPRYPWWTRMLGTVLVSSGICLIMQPGLANVLFSALLGLAVAALVQASGRVTNLPPLLPTLAAFLVSLVAFAAADAGWIVGPLRTLICPIAVLLPGATLATALAELAAGSMIAGASRLIYGVTQLLLFVLGIGMAATIVGADLGGLNNVRPDSPLGWFALPLGLVAISLGMTFGESLPPRLAPWAFGLLLLTYAAQVAGQTWGGSTVGAFMGAAVASFGAAVIVLVSPRVPRIVIFLPSFWLLVPGTLGVLSLTQLGKTGTGATVLLAPVVAVAIALALGLLVGSAGAQPLSRVARQINQRRKRAEAASAEAAYAR